MVIAYHLPRFNMTAQSSSVRGYSAKAGQHESLAGIRDLLEQVQTDQLPVNIHCTLQP